MSTSESRAPALALQLTEVRRPGKDLLVRALGMKTGVRTVVDATAGLGRDSCALAAAGFVVTACERAPVLRALWSAATLPPGVTFCAVDAIAYLLALPDASRPDAVYLDPMYAPVVRKSAPKRAMLDVRAVAGDDDDVMQLFAAARAVARLRVVVKRPKRAPALDGSRAHAFEGASTRFDLFLTPS